MQQPNHIDLYGVHMRPISTLSNGFGHHGAYLGMDGHICTLMGVLEQRRALLGGIAPQYTAMFLFRQDNIRGAEKGRPVRPKHPLGCRRGATVPLTPCRNNHPTEDDAVCSSPHQDITDPGRMRCATVGSCTRDPTQDKLWAGQARHRSPK